MFVFTKTLISNEKYLIFKEIYLYSIKYICNQSKILVFNEKYFYSNTREHNFK